MDIYGNPIDTASISAAELAEKLARFYCEAKPKDTDKRKEKMATNHAEEYHKNTLRNIRGAINRHLQDIGREMDIVRDKEFKHSNSILNGFLKERMRSGSSKPTAHKEIIDNEDLKRNRHIPSKCTAASHYPEIVRLVQSFSPFHHQGDGIPPPASDGLVPVKKR